SEFDGFVEGGLGQANGLRGDADASAIESGESDLQALAFFTEAIGGGDFAIVEDDFHGGRRTLAHFVFVTADGEAGEGGFDKESGDSLPCGGGIGFGEDEIDAGMGTVGDPGFGAGEEVVTRDSWKRNPRAQVQLRYLGHPKKKTERSGTRFADLKIGHYRELRCTEWRRRRSLRRVRLGRRRLGIRLRLEASGSGIFGLRWRSIGGGAGRRSW